MDPAEDLRFVGVSFADAHELACLRVLAMRESLERIGRFDPDRARERFLSNFDPTATWWIQKDGHRVGFFVFRPAEEGFLLDHLYIHPDSQGSGIGSAVMRHLIAIAERQKAKIRVGALKESDSNRFYLRHGFEPVSEGEWDIYYERK